MPGGIILLNVMAAVVISSLSTRIKYIVHKNVREDKMRLVRYDVWSLDVWGNEEEGFTVNDRCCVYQSLEFPTYPQGYNRSSATEFWEHWPSKQQLIDTLKEAGIMAALVKPNDIDIDGEHEYSLNIDDASNGYPLWQLEYVGTGINEY
jgi:hypothetical protein